MTTWKLLLPALFLAASGCQLGIGVEGSGKPASESRSVEPFTAVRLSCECSLELRAQAQQRITISGDDNIVPLITTQVSNGTLVIGAAQNYSPREKLRVTIEAAQIGSVAFSGAGDADLKDLKADKLSLAISGAAHFVATGEARELDLRISGAGSIDARTLKAQVVRAQLSGTGSIDTWASEQIDARTSGVGNINYFGNPKVANTHVSGVGSISRK